MYTDTIRKVLDPAECDGQMLWIHKILSKGWRTSQRNNVTYEDYFQDFMVYWIKRRSKYDPSRGMLSTFVSVVATSFIRSRIRLAKKAQNRGKWVGLPNDVGNSKIEYTTDELRVIEAWSKLETHRAQGVKGRLCGQLEMPEDRLMEILETLQEKVQMRSHKDFLVYV